MNERAYVPSKRVAVIMQRRAVQNRWQSEVWEPAGILVDATEGEARQIVNRPDTSQWLHYGFDVVLRIGEAEGYFHNVSSAAPCAFVLWRMDDAGRGVPQFVTLSYDEASRWMDGGENVDRVPLPTELFVWAGEYVERNYRQEPKKRIKPQSFLSPRDRARR